MLEKHYMLVTKGTCGYCEKAINILKENELSFAYTDMGNAEKLLDITKEQLSWETVPIIWEQTLQWEGEHVTIVESSFVGGYSELAESLGVIEEND